MTDLDADPLRPRVRPGVRVEAEAATWESTVFAISVGSTGRYLEVPAEQVGEFLTAVDAGTLDEELVALATTATGAALDLPGRIRKLAAFDRLVRAAVSRAERDPVTGQLTEPGWRPRKRRRDEDDHSESEQSQGDQHPDAQAKSQSNPATQQAAQPVSASSSTAAPVASPVAVTVVATAATTASKAGWWSSPLVVAGAVAAVVVVAAGSIFVATRSSGDAATAAPAVSTASSADVASATGSGGLPTTASNGSSGSAVEPTAPTTAGESVTAAAGTTGGLVSEPAGASAGSAGAGGAVSSGAVSAGSVLSTPDPAAASAVVPPASGPVNPFAGTYSLTRTVTDNSGNPDVAVGAVDSGTVTLTADCADPGCAVTGGGWGPAAVSGSQLTFAGTSSEPCTSDPAISVIDSWTVTLNADGPVAAGVAVASLQGVGTVTVSELNGCDATIAPITWSYALTRTG